MAGLENIYFHRYHFNLSYKPFSSLISLSRRGPLNPSSPTFYNINVTEAMLNLLVVWKFNQK